MYLVFTDKCLLFGAVNGVFIFERISDAICFILAQEDVHIWNYIDDIFDPMRMDGGHEKLKKCTH